MKPTAKALAAIETALEIEKDGLAFYTEAAKQTDDPHGKRMFQTLADDEAAHLKLFRTVHESLLAGDSWLPQKQVAEISPGKLTRPPIFPPVQQAQQIEIPERQLAALRRGIQAEEDSIAFYTEQKAKTDDPDARAMYTYLIEQEEGHRTILQGEYDYLTNTGFWFDIQEFDLETTS